MSPLDDELRAALQSRASSVAASPDPLAGIERRATRMRRHRLAASVAGTALAVAALAGAVPLLQDAGSPALVPPQVATAEPSPSARSTPAASVFALDPKRPWPYRGIPVEELGQNSLDVITDEYATKRRVADPRVTLTPLFGQRYEPAGRTELVFLADVDGEQRWGVVAATESGPEFLWDEPLPDSALALAAALPGDEVPRLLVVTSPDAGPVYYGSVEANESSMVSIEPGVAVAALDRDIGADHYRVVADGAVLMQADAPNPEPSNQPAPGPAVATPDNVVDWPARGQRDAPLEERAVQAFAEAKGAVRDDVDSRVLFTADTDGGTSYTVIQAWTDGSRAQVFALVETPGRDPEPVLQPLTDPGEPVVAILLTDQPGRTTDELVVVPQPRTGQVFYTAEGTSERRPVEPAPGLDGIVLIDRPKGAQSDRLFVVDGNGDMDQPTYDGDVRILLCGEKGCG